MGNSKIKALTLPRMVVSLDIETTGLDPSADSIIEIGAVKFNGNRVEAEWHSLVNPNRRIPDAITALTGIDNSMVRNAPLIREVVAELEEFVGNSPILGQNIQFDLSFLRRQKIFLYNDTIDTYDLASVLMPGASRYNLAALGKMLGIPLPNSHRALDDARLTHAVFMRLYEDIHALPVPLVREVVIHGEQLSWPGTAAFKFALADMEVDDLAPTAKQTERMPIEFVGQQNFAELELVAGEIVEEPLDAEEAAAYLDHGSAFARHAAQFERRPEQLEMLRAVADTLTSHDKLLVEAGTGVGKSFAYLIPAALFAIKNHTRVVISTNTINLQDQLIKKDIPAIGKMIGQDVQAALLKGRGNYLCPRRFMVLRQNGPSNLDEMRVLGKVLVWVANGASGDRTEITLNRPGERDAWSRVNAEDEHCSADTCGGRMGGSCPFFRARQNAQNAHIIVVNHALLLADMATSGMVLPQYDHLVIDEGHHLEEAVTGALSFRVNQQDLERLLKEVGDSGSGNLGYLLSITRNYIRPADFAGLGQQVKKVGEASFHLENYLRVFFTAVAEFVRAQSDGRSNPNYSFQLRITPAQRAVPGWDNIEITWANCADSLTAMYDGLQEIYKAIVGLYTDGYDNLEDSIGEITKNLNMIKEVNQKVTNLINQPENNAIYWIETGAFNNGRLALNIAPLRIGPLLKKGIWDVKKSVVLTSATLTTNGEYDYLKNTLNAQDASHLTLGSPFDYENSAVLFLPTDLPEPNAPGYENALNRAIIDTASVSGGRMLVLFTNLAQLRRCGQAINHSLSKLDITVFEQGDGASPAMLLESFKATPRAVLLGTRSFWEGVDVQGESLSVVIITRLPFEVPSDPIVAARSETFEDPFNEYQVPEAILKFRQGFGRLIRSNADKGVVAVLDRRVLTKNYGSLFINSLPQCTVRRDSISRLPDITKRFLGE